jgi:hypothetical protein
MSQYQDIFQRWVGWAGFWGIGILRAVPTYIDISIPLFWTYSPLMYQKRLKMAIRAQFRHIHFFSQFTGTGLIGALLTPYFQIPAIRALESEITSFAGRKTGLIIPFWLADRRSDGLK